MSSGGGLRFGRGLARLYTCPVDVRHPLRDFGQQLGRVQPPKRLLGHQQRLQMTAVAFSTRLNRLAAVVRSRTVANGDSIGFVVRSASSAPAGIGRTSPGALSRGRERRASSPRSGRPASVARPLARLGVRGSALSRLFASPGVASAACRAGSGADDSSTVARRPSGRRGQGAPDPEMAVADHHARRPRPAAWRSRKTVRQLSVDL